LPNGNYNAAGLNIYSSGDLYLPGKIQLGANFNYSYQAAVNGIPALYRRVLNATVTKSFFKDENLKLIVSGNNLLNQDQIQRTPASTGSGFTQTSYNTIKRFFMLTVTWDFTKFGTSSSSTSAPASTPSLPSKN